MSNMDIQDYDLGSLIIKNPEFETGLLQFAGADTFVEGTILARKEVVAAITPVAGSNTGDGTCAASVVGGDKVPKVGSYVLECTFAVANGGVFKLTDPNGTIVANNLTLRVGDGLVTTFVEDGLSIAVTEGGTTSFAAGDLFTLPVVADGDWVIYDADGVGGAQIPKGVLPVEEVRTGSGDSPTRVLIKGTVRADKLVIDAGDTVTDKIKDALREVGIIALDTTDLSVEDND